MRLQLQFMANGPNKSIINLLEANKITRFYGFLAETLYSCDDSSW